jgi:hypothetical protein
MTATAAAETRLAPSFVPEGYAQKAMASLMQLHSELMGEKERRVELFRQLMQKEQAIAELKMYVKMLEERLEKKAPARPPQVRPAQPKPPPPPPRRPRLAAVPPPPPPAAPAPQASPRASNDGWRTW